jgi:hypothetical protein
VTGFAGCVLMMERKEERMRMRGEREKERRGETEETEERRGETEERRQRRERQRRGDRGEETRRGTKYILAGTHQITCVVWPHVVWSEREERGRRDRRR